MKDTVTKEVGNLAPPRLTKKTREIIELAVEKLPANYKGDPYKITESVVDVMADLYGTVLGPNGKKEFGEGDDVIPRKMNMGTTKAIKEKVNIYLRGY